MRILVGTYTDGGSVGIYCHELDLIAKTVKMLGVVAVDNPSYFTVSPNNEVIYAISENGVDNSVVNTVSLDALSGEMRLLNSIDDVGWGPCHILQIGNRLLVSNFGDGSASVYGINSDGSIAQCVQQLKFNDNIPKSRIHFSAVSPDGRYVIIVNHGGSCIYLYQIGNTAKCSRLTHKETIRLVEGCCPRHGTFNADGTMFYLVTEKSNEIIAFDYCAESGHLRIKQAEKIPCNKRAASADIHLSADGRYLYASVRLCDDGIAIYSVGTDGMLSYKSYVPTGLHPRNFIVTPDDKVVLVACRDSNEIEVYSRNSETGLLTHLSGCDIHLSKPVCIKLLNG